MDNKVTKKAKTRNGMRVRYRSDDGVLWVVLDAEHGDPIAHASLSMAGYPTVVSLKGRWRPFRAETLEKGAILAVEKQERWKRDVLAEVADNGRRYAGASAALGYNRGPYSSGSVATAKWHGQRRSAP